MFKLKLIGSGCWQGVPAPFGDDVISKNVEWDSKNFRFRTSLSIETENKKNIIVEATPDIRLQSWKFNLKAPDAVLISHWHWDHFFGLLDLDWFVEKNGLTVYGNKVTKQWYNEKMNHLKGIDFKIFSSYESFSIDNIIITPITVNHVEDTDGFLFEDKNTKRKFAYLPDLNGIPNRTTKLTTEIDAIIVDATYLESDLSDDPTHLHKNELVTFLKSLKAKEIILSNIGSFQGLTHEDLESKFPQYTISYDGLERIFV